MLPIVENGELLPSGQKRVKPELGREEIVSLLAKLLVRLRDCQAWVKKRVGVC
jgi:hypothetical protein